MGSLKILTVVLLAMLTVVTPAGADTLEGHWVLVEQFYGGGKANMAPDDQPVRMEFVRQGAGLEARVWTGDERAAALDWPAFVIEGRALPVQVVERSSSGGLDEVRVRYRIEPAPGDGLVLEITETYRLVEGGKELVGDLTVAFLQDGKPRGSYVLHRRLERAP